MKRRKVILTTLLLLLLISGGLFWRLNVLRERALLSRPLIAAIKAGEIKTVKSLLERGADPDARDMPDVPKGIWEFIKTYFDAKKRAEQENYPTALLIAASPWEEIDYAETSPTEERKAEILRLLLAKGADVNGRSANGETALMRACNTWGAAPFARILIEHGANVRLTDKQTFTALYYAMSNNRKELYGSLVERGADVNTRDSDRETLLMDVTSEGDTRLVETILTKGADPNTECDGYTPLLYAFNITAHNYEYNTRELLAPERTGQEIMRLLLKFGAKPDTVDTDSVPLLWRAIDDNRAEVVRLLLEHGANLHIRQDNQTPLMQAVVQRNTDIVRLLLEHGAKTQPPLDINAQDADGQTALMIASYDGDTDIVRLLLEHGADPKLRDREQQTAYFYAADSPDIRALLQP